MLSLLVNEIYASLLAQIVAQAMGAVAVVVSLSRCSLANLSL